MQTVLIVIHLLIVVALVISVLLQRSEGGALGIGGGGGGGGGFMTGRGTANVLTRTTAILAVGFFATSLTLAVLAGRTALGPSIFDSAPQQGGAQTPAGEGGGEGGVLDELRRMQPGGGESEGGGAPQAPQSQ